MKISNVPLPGYVAFYMRQYPDGARRYLYRKAEGEPVQKEAKASPAAERQPRLI